MDMDPQRDAFDYIVLMGQASPGKAEVSGGKTQFIYEEQAGAGIEGASLNYKGKGLAEFDVKITLWEIEHWLEWATWREILAPPPTGIRPTAMQLQHPLVDELGANAVVLTERSQMSPDGESGAWTISLKFKEYRKPTPLLGNTTANGTIDKPDDAAENPFQFGKNAFLESLNAKAEGLEKKDAETP